jgi:PPOX class probable FMN-dependent enzyme
MDSPLPPDPFAVTAPEQLAALYGPANERSLLKVTPRLDAASRAFIAASPFCVLSTVGARGVHGTPRGDAPGFVQPLSDTLLALPDRRGNNRIDALRDLLDDPRLALLFLVPGAGETLRVNGTGRLTTDPALRARFAVEGKEPATVLLVEVAEVFMQCARALHRSRLWGDRRPAPAVPTAGQLLEAATGGAVQATPYDAELYERAMKTLY